MRGIRGTHVNRLASGVGRKKKGAHKTFPCVYAWRSRERASTRRKEFQEWFQHTLSPHPDPPPEVTSIKPESWFPNPPCRDWLLFRSRPGVSSLSKCPASRDLPPKRAPLPSHRLSRNLEVTFRDYWLPDGIRSLEDILSLATGSKDLRSLTRSRTVLPISYGYYGD